MLSDFLTYSLLFFTGLFAGTVDAIAGGGGLISLPMLLSIGVPPHIALGTNKLQGAMGTFVATYNYYRKDFISLKTVFKGLAFGVLGTILGVLTSQILEKDSLKRIIPWLLVIILCYTIFTPKIGYSDSKPKIKESIFYIVFGFFLGFYDGFFGPGTGSFWLFSFTFFLGFNLTKASAYTKVFNLKSNIIAIICFACCYSIDYQIALCMGCGQIIGGNLGAHFAIKKGAQLIRPLFIIIVSFTLCTLFYKNYKFIFIQNSFVLVFILCLATIFFASIYIYVKQKRRNN